MKADSPRRHDVAAIRAALDTHGLLLVHDTKLPSVTTIVAGKPIAGSWWAHAAGGRVFGALSEIEDDGLVIAPLVLAKQTLVHPRLVPALVAACRPPQPWQPKPTALARQVERSGELRTADLEQPERAAGKKLATALVVMGRQEHGERGAHETVLESWEHFARRTKCTPLGSAELGRAALEASVAGWGAPRLFPWQKPARPTTRR